MLKHFILLYLFAISLCAYSQSVEVDLAIEEGKKLFFQDKFDASLEAFDDAVSKADNNSIELANTYYRIGRFYADHSIDEMALKYYFLAVQECELIGDSDELLQETYNYIGGSYYNRLYYLEAKKYWNKSLEINKQISNKKGLSSNLNNLGEIEIKNENYEAALELIREASQLKKEVNDTYGYITTMTNLGELKIKLGDLDSAKYFLEQSEIVAIQYKHDHLLQYLAIAYGELSRAEGKIDDAITFYHKSLTYDLIIANPDNSVRKNVYSSLMSIYKELNMPDSSLHYQIKLIELEEQLLDKEKRILQTSQEVHRLVNTKDQEIEALKEQARRNKIILVSVIVFILVASLFLYVITRSRKKILKQKRTTLKREKELQHLKSQFITAASHEIRTPLSVIQSNIAVLAMQKDQMSESLQGKFDKNYARIMENISRLTQLVDDLLMIDKLSSEDINLEIALINIEDSIDKVLARKSDEYGRNIAFEVNGVENMSLVNLNASLFEKILSSIVDNALKYSEGSADPKVILNYGDNIVLIVEDHGIGIPESELEHIYKPFYKTSIAEHYPGSGMGLSLAKQYMDLMDGKLSVRSKENSGTSVKLSFRK